MPRPFGFDKSRHLFLQRDIDPLFSDGLRFTCYPFRVLYRVRRESTGVRLLIVARKRNFRNAVDRNHWRRMIRESYRTRQSILDGLNLDICITVIADKVLPTQQVAERMQTLLTTLRRKLTPQ